MESPVISTHEWPHRAKHLLNAVADQLMVRLATRLWASVPGVAVAALYLFLAGLFVGGGSAWLSSAAWSALRERGFAASGAALLVAAGLILFAGLFMLAARSRIRLHAKAPPSPAAPDLANLFNPSIALQPHAVKVLVASTAFGFFIALNHSSRKEA